MEIDRDFLRKQLVAIDDQHPAHITDALAIWGEVYARAIMRLLAQLGAKAMIDCLSGHLTGRYFFNPKNRKGLKSLERSGLVGVGYEKYTGIVELPASYYPWTYQGDTYRFITYYNDVPQGRKWKTVDDYISFADVAWWEQLYNCLCRELEEVRQKEAEMS